MNDNYQQYLNQNGGPSPTAAATPTGGQPSTLDRLLPTIGSVGGGLLGLINPLLGIGGAAAGGALGQQLENDLSGTKGSTLAAGAEGGVGQGIGMGVGALGGALLGKVSQAAGNVADNAAIRAGFGNVAAGDREALGFGDALKTAEANNIPQTPEAFSELGQRANGGPTAPGDLNNLVDHAVNTAKSTIDLGEVTNTAQQAIGAEKGALGELMGTPKPASRGMLQFSPTTGSKLYADINATFAPLTDAARAGQTMAGSDARDVLQGIGNQLGEAKTIASRVGNSGLDPSEANARVRVLQKVYNNLKGQIYTPEADQVIADAHLEPDGTPIGNHLANVVNRATSVQDLLDEMQKVGNMGRLGDIALNKNANALPGEVLAEASPNSGAVLGNNHAAVQAVSMVHPGVASVAQLLSRVPARGLSNVTGVLSKIPAAVPGSLTAGAAQLPTLAEGTGAGSSSPLNSSSINAGESQTMSPQANPNIGQEIRLASMYAPNLLPSLTSANQASAAQGLLGNLEGAYTSAGGGQGGLGGLLTQLSSLIPGTPAYQYAQQRAAVASAIAKATGLNPATVGVALPSLMAGSGAANQFGGLSSLLQQTTAPAAGYSPSPSILSTIGNPSPGAF